jgi:bifunctional non-homologous end joining protein LigD
VRSVPCTASSWQFSSQWAARLRTQSGLDPFLAALISTSAAVFCIHARIEMTGVLFIRPCNPTTAKTIPVGDPWLHEPKLDGYRLQVVKEGHQLRIYSRRGNEWTERLPRLVAALADITCRSAIIDAELCLPGAGGAPNFYGLPAAMRRGRQRELVVFAFDLLYRDGNDLRTLPLIERRRRLER